MENYKNYKYIQNKSKLEILLEEKEKFQELVGNLFCLDRNYNSISSKSNNIEKLYFQDSKTINNSFTERKLDQIENSLIKRNEINFLSTKKIDNSENMKKKGY